MLYIGLFLACVTDYARRRIPNRIVILLIAWGVLRCVGDGWTVRMLEYGLTGLAVAVFFYPLYRIGALGAGDIKLLGAAAGYFPGERALGFLCCSFLVAAVAALFRICREGNGKQRLIYLAEYVMLVAQTGSLRIYEEELRDKRKISICLAGPMLIGALLQGGGIP